MLYVPLLVTNGAFNTYVLSWNNSWTFYQMAISGKYRILPLELKDQPEAPINKSDKENIGFHMNVSLFLLLSI